MGRNYPLDFSSSLLAIYFCFSVFFFLFSVLFLFVSDFRRKMASNDFSSSVTGAGAEGGVSGADSNAVVRMNMVDGDFNPRMQRGEMTFVKFFRALVRSLQIAGANLGASQQQLCRKSQNRRG